jgi:hypothetical protein
MSPRGAPTRKGGPVAEYDDQDDEPVLSEPGDPPSIDPLLRRLVRAVNLSEDRAGADIGVLVRGRTVFGTMISTYAWFQIMVGFLIQIRWANRLTMTDS